MKKLFYLLVLLPLCADAEPRHGRAGKDLPVSGDGASRRRLAGQHAHRAAGLCLPIQHEIQDAAVGILQPYEERLADFGPA